MKKDNKDYYSVLGIEKTANAEEIKKAYRVAAMKYHPDRNKETDATEKFKEINEAYEILSDDDKRAHYDRFGSEDMGTSGFRDPRETFSHFSRFNMGNGDRDFEEFVRSQMFGNANRQRREVRFGQKTINPDIKIACNIHIKDAIKGGDIELSIQRNIACDKCKTVGVGKVTDTCKVCNGEGFRSSMVGGNMFVRQSCPSCQGSGKNIEPCSDCQGAGYSQIEEKLSIKIPKGVLNGSVLRLKDKGHITYNNDDKINGSVYIIVQYPETEEDVVVIDGDIYTSIFVPIDLVLSNEKIKVSILGVKKLSITLDRNNESGHDYIVNDGGINENKKAFVKVFLDLPKKDISEEDRVKLTNMLKEIYGGSSTTFKPSAIHR